MSTLKLVAIWGMLAGVAVIARHSPWDFAVGLCTIAAILASAGPPKPKTEHRVSNVHPPP